CTGARRSQAAHLLVGDLQEDQHGAFLHMPSSLKGKGEKRIDHTRVPIPTSLALTLRQGAAGRRPTDPLLPKADRAPWSNSDLRPPFRTIVAQAGLDPDRITSYALRHSSITRQLLRGVPLRSVAASHDTSVPMIEASYSKLIANHGDALIRGAMLDFGAPAV